jgi:hypothetical protein
MRFTYSSRGSFDAPGKSLRGPSCCGGRNPLIVFERKSALEIRLESNRAAPNVPGSVWILGAQQILNATAMRQVGGAQEPGLAQGVQGKSGGMRVAAEIRVACPSAIAPLLGEQRIRHFPLSRPLPPKEQAIGRHVDTCCGALLFCSQAEARVTRSRNSAARAGMP